MSFKARQQRVLNDLNHMFAHQQPVQRSISLYSAMARALKYNLDIELKNYETILVTNKLRASKFEMWPQIMASAGYLTRSNINAASSFQLATGTFNFSSSTSEDINRNTANLQFSWNVLDIGIGYLTSRQHANQFLVALQRRRSIIQNVIRDVRYAYWRALSMQQLAHQIKPLLKQVHWAIRQSQRAQALHLTTPLTALEYQKTLFEILRQLTELERQIIQSKAELSALMNIKPGVHYLLQMPSYPSNPLPRHFPMKLRLLERVALYDRPELREEDYRHRISLDEITKARIRMLPGIEATGALNHDTNSFLLNNYWANAGFFLTWNVFNLFSGPAQIAAAKTHVKLDDFRRLALSMVIMTQVDVAYYRYFQARKELAVLQKLKSVNHHIDQQITNLYREHKAKHLRLIQAHANVVLADLRYHLAYAQWQNAVGQLLASVGYDPVSVINTNLPLAVMAKKIKHYLTISPHVSFERQSIVSHGTKHFVAATEQLNTRYHLKLPAPHTTRH